MTKQCLEVMSACDLRPEEAREVEMLLLKHTPDQVIKLLWSKDPKGEHRLEWFRPFFDRGYVKRKLFIDLAGPADEDFWEALDWASQASDGLTSYDLAAVWEMSRDPRRMRAAFGKAKVSKVAYVLQVFRGMPQSRAAGRTVVDFEIGNCGNVKTRNIV